MYFRHWLNFQLWFHPYKIFKYKYLSFSLGKMQGRQKKCLFWPFYWGSQEETVCQKLFHWQKSLLLQHPLIPWSIPSQVALMFPSVRKREMYSNSDEVAIMKKFLRHEISFIPKNLLIFKCYDILLLQPPILLTHWIPVNSIQ